ncbi:MAG: aminotransferase class III-fold pyridoxal phosphate-dependent enzyme [Rhodospirillales bacterium]|nr:aminotransferase class III-fold pyridoxal phosphate-dependent enzyme [Rhodospirillales bacterium]
MLKKAFPRVLNEGYGGSGSSLRMQSASGATITDTDGNTYIDTAMGGGTCILGHANPLVVDAVNRQMHQGSLFTVANPYAEDFAECLAQAIPGCDQFVFASTGSEATLRAIRLARAVTDKNKIAVFSGGWHGSHDQVLVEEDYSRGSESTPAMMPKSAGILDGVLDNLVFLPYNTQAAFDLIRANKDDLAAVMIEPVQGSNPRDDVEEFLRDLRQVTEDLGVLLILDEVITGFRLALGGAQERFGIRADIVTYGKTLGGGLPIGVLSGTPEVLSHITTDHDGEKLPVFNGGTFSANPLTMAAGMAVVRYLTETSEQTYGRLEQAGETVRADLNAHCRSNGVPAQVIGIGSMFRTIFTDKPVRSRRDRDLMEIPYQAQRDFYAQLLSAGVHVGGNGINFISLAHTDGDLDKICACYREALSSLTAES